MTGYKQQYQEWQEQFDEAVEEHGLIRGLGKFWSENAPISYTRALVYMALLYVTRLALLETTMPRLLVIPVALGLVYTSKIMVRGIKKDYQEGKIEWP